MSDFVIDKLQWYIDKGVHHDPQKKFRTLLDFLQRNSLLNEGLSFPVGMIPGDFALRSSDLSAEGLELFKKSYHKWLKSIDKGKPETDTSLLERELRKIRER